MAIKYSQNNEADLIDAYFSEDRTWGVFADLGCNDMVTLSNTYHLLRRGWAGLLVEASPKAIDRLYGNVLPYRKQVYIFEGAIGDHNGEIEFYESGELLGQNDVSLVSSTKEDELKRWESIKMSFEKIKVQSYTWDYI